MIFSLHKIAPIAALLITYSKYSNGFASLTKYSKSNMQNKVATSDEISAVSIDEDNELVPPLQNYDHELMSELYENSVQKTYGRYPVTITHGKGCRLYSKSGKSYLDFVAGIATCALGHSNEELSSAITKQMSQLHHISNLYYIPEQALLAKWLCDNSVADKVFFCNSGAEANEAAIKLARRYASNRGVTEPVILTAINSFHGRTLAAVTATAQPKYHKGFGFGGEMVRGFEYIDYNDSEALQKKVSQIGDNLAAIMVEPLQGEGGIIPGDPAFFKTARDLCDEYDALLMIDEVQVGMGRSGKLWGYENLDIVPDVFTSAKALGAGVPIGAMMAKGKAADTFGPGDHASTFGGNPLACAAGLATAQYLYDHNVLSNVKQRGEQLSKQLENLVSNYSFLGEVRGWGLIKGVVVKQDSGITASDVVAKAMDHGLLLVPAGLEVVRFVPPLIVTKDDVDQAVKLFQLALDDVAESSS